MVFNRQEIDSRSPDQIEHNIIVDHEFTQVVAGPKPFAKTFNQLPRVNRTGMVPPSTNRNS